MSIMKYMDYIWREPHSVSELGKKTVPPLVVPWLSHINFDVTAIDFLCFMKLIFPDFLEHDGSIFIKHQFSEKGYATWKEKGLSRTELEKLMNHVHICDIFSYDRKSNQDDFVRVAEALKETWSYCLSTKFPDRMFHITVERDDDDCVITFHSIVV